MPITRKQLELISKMQTYTEIRFEGKTRKDASEYISSNMDTYRKAIREHWIQVKENRRKFLEGHYRVDRPVYNMYKKF